jgi:hypothetical protein
MFTDRELSAVKEFASRKLEDKVRGKKGEDISNADLLDIVTLNQLKDGADNMLEEREET